MNLKWALEMNLQRNKQVLVAVLLLIASSALCQIDNPIIHNVRLFDGDTVYENVTVTTQEGIITQIRQNDQLTKGANSIDGSGYTLIPGMINAHMHTSVRKNLREAITSGVLCVLDMKINSSLDYAKLKALGQDPDYPYFYSANNAVTVPKGHASEGTKTLKSDEETVAFVEERIAEGLDFIKIMLDHGYTYKMPTLTDYMLETTIKVARDNGLLSVAHVSRHEDALKAAKFGVSGLAHVWLFDSIPISEENIQVLKGSGIFIIPTLIVFRRGVELKGNPSNMELLNSEVFRLYQAGIPILAGSDPPNYKVNFGSDLIEELKLFVELGIPEIEALKTVTSNTSTAFGLGQIGFIKKGASADFVLIRGDPTENIQDLDNIEGIWKSGRHVIPKKNEH